MRKRILVCYATKTGSTRETAEAIAKELESKGFEAEAHALAQAGDLSSYDGVVVGAPVNGMAWHPEALAFVRDNAAAAACFGGVMQAEAPLPLRLAFGIKKGAPRDSRNWDDIRAFADEIAAKMA